MLMYDLLNAKAEEYKQVITCRADETVGDAIAKLLEYKIGAIVVMDGERPVGMFSERDVVRLVHNGGVEFRDTVLANSLMREVVRISADQEVTDAMQLMETHRVRHLTVMENDKMVGFASLRDLILFNIECANQAKEHLQQQIIDQSKPLPM